MPAAAPVEAQLGPGLRRRARAHLDRIAAAALSRIRLLRLARRPLPAPAPNLDNLILHLIWCRKVKENF